MITPPHTPKPLVRSSPAMLGLGPLNPSYSCVDSKETMMRANCTWVTADKHFSIYCLIWPHWIIYDSLVWQQCLSVKFLIHRQERRGPLSNQISQGHLDSRYQVWFYCRAKVASPRGHTGLQGKVRTGRGFRVWTSIQWYPENPMNIFENA